MNIRVLSVNASSERLHSLQMGLGLLLVLACAAFCSAQAHTSRPKGAAQSVPDLTGVWKLNKEKSDLRRWAKVTPDSIVIHQTQRTVQFDYKLGAKDLSKTYTTDGSTQVVSTIRYNHEKLARAYRSKDALIVEERVVAHFAGFPDFEDVQMTTTRWSLSSDGKTLTAKNRERATTAVFDLDKPSRL